jgi:hypothetical protein
MQGKLMKFLESKVQKKFMPRVACRRLDKTMLFLDSVVCARGEKGD